MDLRYPIGPFDWKGSATADDRLRSIEAIERAPAALRSALVGLNAEQLDTPYRPGGWTVRQVAHHVPESHMNAYIRFKLALTEDQPTIKPYDENLWSQTPDVRLTPIETSLAILEALHQRWVILLRSLKPADFARTFTHPQYGKTFPLDWALAMYAWHGAHHTAHITSLRERMGWK
ncbi:MAG TPA: putative metal-dependent hydrolase [Terriglobales bacterium]|nr:putative metal-dependent hydrolase [Terriglobales bacterium]